MKTLRRARALAVGCTLVLAWTAGCGQSGTATPTPLRTAGTLTSPSPAQSDATAVPESSSPTPPASESPGPATATPGPGTPSETASPLSCTSVTPIRVQRLSTEPRRTTEVVVVISDGRNLTSGTREQTEFLTPTLAGPDGTEITDEQTMRAIADLVAGSAKNRVLLARPEPPDARADTNRRPFNAPGTYVLYHASTPLTGDVIVQCSGQEQRWVFTAEADLSTGQVNCAVEPPKSNAIARLVYVNNC